MPAQPHLSVAAPCYNEEEGIEAVVSGWVETLRGAPFDWEIVVTNDGSTDATPSILERLHRNDARAVLVASSRTAAAGRRPHDRGYVPSVPTPDLGDVIDASAPR